MAEIASRHRLPVLTPDQAVADVPDGAIILIGGFSGGGAPYELVRALQRHGARQLTIVTNNISIRDNNDILAESGQLRKVISSFPVPASADQLTWVERRFRAGELEVESVPQGTLVERIRAAGAGLGGIFTPTGVGTLAAAGKEVREIDGVEYLFEKPIRGDYALIRAFQADEMGNLVYRGNARNFNPIMATAATVVIAQVESIVPVGALDPERVGTPGICVDRLCLVAKE